MLDYKDIITKHCALGMTGSAIAETLGVSKSGVRCFLILLDTIAGSELVAELLHFALSVENLLDEAFLEVKRESLRLLVDPALELIDYGVFSHTDLRSLHRCCTASHFPE